MLTLALVFAPVAPNMGAPGTNAGALAQVFLAVVGAGAGAAGATGSPPFFTSKDMVLPAPAGLGRYDAEMAGGAAAGFPASACACACACMCAVLGRYEAEIAGGAAAGLNDAAAGPALERTWS